MQPNEYTLFDADTAEAVMAAKDEILSITESFIGQLPEPLSENEVICAMKIPLLRHRSAVAMAEELMVVHEGANPADELLYLYAEQLMLLHLQELANLTDVYIAL